MAKLTLKPSERYFLAGVHGDDGRIEAALPLAINDSGDLRALTCDFSTIYAPWLGQNEASYSLGRNAARYVKSTLLLDCLDPDFPGMDSFLSGLRESGLMQSSYKHFENWYDDIDSFDIYWSSRPGQLRQTVKRRQSTLSLRHEVETTVYRDLQEMDQALDLYEDVYRHSWKKEELYPSFLREMCKALASSDSVCVAILRLDGDPAAAQIWLTAEAQATIFKLAHKEQYDRYSVGTLLTFHVLKCLKADHGPISVDFGRGGDRYKRNWLSRCRCRTGLIVANPKNIRSWQVIARDIVPSRLKKLMIPK